MTATSELRIVEVRIPTLDQVEKTVVGPINEAHDVLEKLTLRLTYCVAYTASDRWAARLPHPPTLEEIASIAITVDNLDREAGFLRDQADELRNLVGPLDVLRLRGARSEHTAANVDVLDAREEASAGA